MNVDRYLEGKIAPIPESGCWVWMGSISPTGYSTGRPEGKNVRIHRWLYEKLNGPVGDLAIDHLCRVRCCVNPYHLEAVTTKENVLRGVGPTAENARKTHCEKGHPFDNSFMRSSGEVRRKCLTCARERDAKVRAKKRAARLAAASPPMSCDIAETMRRLRRAGHSITEVSELTGMPYQSAYDVLVRGRWPSSQPQGSQS